MSGPQAISETALIQGCLRQLPPENLVMADAGFGIFTVAYAARQASQKFLLRLSPVRLSPVRFQALQRQATLVAQHAHSRTWSLDWQPSRVVRREHPELPPDARLEVHLHEIPVHDDLTLSLVSDLPDSADRLATLYGQRHDVEIDIRNLKVVLDTEHIPARSGAMFLKELLTSHVAYNLVIQFRRQAAARLRLPPGG